jgi:aspartyl-tRNA synthetase
MQAGAHDAVPHRTRRNDGRQPGGGHVTVAGWVQRRRDHGGVAFFDLRDASGLVQVVADPEEIPVVHDLRMEYCVSVTGEVRTGRPEGTVNPDLPTGKSRSVRQR